MNSTPSTLTKTSSWITFAVTSLLVLSALLMGWKTLLYQETELYAVSLTTDLMKSLASGEMDFTPNTTFKEFDYHPKTFSEVVDTDIQCEAMTDIRGLTFYSANARCHFGLQKVSYYFSKSYDHPVLIFGLGLLGVGLMGASLFLLMKKQHRSTKADASTPASKNLPLPATSNKIRTRRHMVMESLQRFPQILPTDLIALDKPKYMSFIKANYGGFPELAKQRGLNLNNIYRVNRRFKSSNLIVFQYNTLQEIIGLRNAEENNRALKALLANESMIYQATEIDAVAA